MKRVLLLLSILLICSVTFSQDIYPTTISDLNSIVKIYGYGTMEGITPGQEATFQTMTFQESQFQEIDIISESLNINGNRISPTHINDEFGNKYVSFRITENGDFNYEIIANVHTSAKMISLPDYNLSTAPDSAKEYLKSSQKIESDTAPIITLQKSKLTKKSFLGTLADTITWVNDYIDYASGDDFEKYYNLQKSAVETLVDRKGVCDEFSNLAAAMLRAKGIPTRIAIGLTFDGEKWGHHAWIEVYHNSYGWIPSDPTFRETGFVDAMHIHMGSFEDVTQSQAKCYYPDNANCIFRSQSFPEVEIVDKDYFSSVEVTANVTSMKTMQWNDFPINVKNMTSNTINVPLKIIENYQELLVEESKQGIILGPNESATINFRIYPDLVFKQNELKANGNFTLNTLNAPYLEDFEILPSTPLDNGNVIVKDVTPIATGEKLILAIKVSNYTSKDQPVDINVGSAERYNTKNNIEAFSEKVLITQLNSYEEKPYTITVKTTTQTLTQVILPYKTIVKQDPNDENKIIIDDAPKTEDTVPPVTIGPEFFVLIAILIVGLAAFIYFMRKPRYV